LRRYNPHAQLSAAANHARKKGVVLKVGWWCRLTLSNPS